MMCFNKNCKLIHIRGVKRLQDVKVPKKTQPTDKNTNPPKKKATSSPARQSKRSSNETLPPNRTPAINYPPSSKPMNNEDFLKHLAQMKADLTKEVTKNLSALIQSSLQSMMVQQQLQVEPNRQMYPPPPVQFYPLPEVHHPTHSLPTQSTHRLSSTDSTAVPAISSSQGNVGGALPLPISSSFLLNGQGMNPGIKNQRWKIKSIQEEINSSPLHTPFFILTETHLKPHHLEAETCIPGYIALRADRDKRAQGGVAIYLHQAIPADTVKVFSNSFCEVAL